MSHFFLLLFALFIFLGHFREATALLLALGIHEAGHALVARALGYRIEKITLYPIGSYLQLDDLVELNPFSEVRIALAGPVASLFTALLTMTISSQGSGFGAYFVSANLMLMAFNLLPALPLDGGRILRASLIGWTSFYRATEITVFSGHVCGIGLLALGGLYLWQGVPNPTIFAAGVFLLYNAYSEKKNLMVPLMRYAVGRLRQLRGQPLLNADNFVASKDAKIKDVFKFMRPQRYYLISVLKADWTVCGQVSEHKLLSKFMEGAGERKLADLIDSGRED